MASKRRVDFTCDRCGASISYDDGAGLPSGWAEMLLSFEWRIRNISMNEDLATFQHLCPACADLHKRFMEGGKVGDMRYHRAKPIAKAGRTRKR